MIKLAEWKVTLFHSPTQYHTFTQHQGTRAKKEMFQHTFIILFREFLDVLAFPRLLGQAQHPLLTLFVFLLPGLDAIHPVQQNSSSNAKNTPIVTYTLLCKQLKSWTKWSTFGTYGWLLISNTCLLGFFCTHVILHYTDASSIIWSIVIMLNTLSPLIPRTKAILNTAHYEI